MNPAALSLLLAALGAQDPLEEAQAAFARADYDGAERLALRAVAPPRAGAALYLAGLARFRSGRPAEALAALDSAGASEDPPPAAAWHYNRAACMQELGRHREAEDEFLTSARLDAALAAVALVNAGFAALDDGAADRARRHADRARAAASGAALDLVADLEAQLGEGPGGERAQAEERPAPESPPLPRAGFAASLRLDGGWDSDALQSGLRAFPELLDTAQVETPSAFAGVTAAAGDRLVESDRLAVDLWYALAQLAYAEDGAVDRSLQQHALALGLEVAPAAGLRLGASLEGQLAFTGLSSFRGLQAAAVLHGWAALGVGPRATARLDLGATHKEALRGEFSYLGGDRLEAALSQELRLPVATLGAGVRFALDATGTARTASAPVPRSPCAAGCTFVEPLGYAGTTLWLSSRVPLGRRLELGLAAGVEWRNHLDDAFLEATFQATDPFGPSGPLGRQRLHETRWFTGESLALKLTDRVSLLLRHDLLLNRSSADGSSAFATPSGRSHDKHVVTLGTSLTW